MGRQGGCPTLSQEPDVRGLEGAELGTWSLQHQSEQQGEFWKVWQRTGRPSPSFPGQSLGLHLQYAGAGFTQQ